MAVRSQRARVPERQRRSSKPRNRPTFTPVCLWRGEQRATTRPIVPRSSEGRDTAQPYRLHHPKRRVTQRNRLQVARKQGLFFSLTHLFLQPPGCHSAVKRCSWRTLCVRRMPGQASCSLWLHLAQAPCRHRCLALWLFLFLRCHTKGTASSCTVCCLVCNSVQVCSRTARSSELPHLLPPSGLSVRLLMGTSAGLRRPLMCCLGV